MPDQTKPTQQVTIQVPLDAAPSLHTKAMALRAAQDKAAKPKATNADKDAAEAKVKELLDALGDALKSAAQ